jgi:hypothetical protein
MSLPFFNEPGRRVLRLRRAARVTTLLLLVAPSTSRADSLLPLQTETARPLASGQVELILGTTYFRNQRFPAFTPPGVIRSQDLVRGPELGFRAGAGGWAEVQGSFDFIYLNERTIDGSHDEYGNGDFRLFTKLRLLSETARWPGVGLRFGTKLPNASRQDRLGTDEFDFDAEALLSRDFGPLAVHANLGIAILGNPGPVLGDENRSSSGQDDLFVYAVGMFSRSVPFSARSPWAVRLGAEATGATGSRFDNDRHVARGGARLERGPLALYAGASVGLVTASEDYGLSGGLIYSFALERLAGLVE